MSNYPPGMTSRDWDHVEGRGMTDREAECGRCGETRRFLHRGYPSPRAAKVYANCDKCGWPSK